MGASGLTVGNGSRAPGSPSSGDANERGWNGGLGFGLINSTPFTGLSGSRSSLCFRIHRSLADGGVAAGLPRDIALKLAVQTVQGAAKLCAETQLHPAQLKDQVASPAGTTIEGLRMLERGRLRSSVIEAVIAASNRSRELGEGT